MSTQQNQYRSPITATQETPPASPEDTVSISKLELTAADDVPLTATVYSGVQPVGMTALMLPGIGVPQRAFRHLARWLAARGVRCVTVDYRGMGESITPRGTATASLSAWAEADVAAAMTCCERLGPEPVVLIGHSFGGQAVGLSKALGGLRAAVFVGSQFGRTRNWDGAAKWQLAVYWHAILPLIASLYRVLPRWSGPAGPLPRGVAREWARWGRSSDWYVSYAQEASTRLARFSAPILAYGISDDTIAPPRAVSDFLARFSATKPVRRDVSPSQLALQQIGHTGLLRPLQEVEIIWNEMLEFLRGQVAPAT